MLLKTESYIFVALISIWIVIVYHGTKDHFNIKRDSSEFIANTNPNSFSYNHQITVFLTNAKVIW